jgi:hypothetical protein
MSRAVISCVVEGHGEVRALPVLVRRLVPRLFPGEYVEVPQPHRQNRSKLMRAGELERAVDFAAMRVRGGPGGVLVLLDADDDCPAESGPQLLARAKAAAPDLPTEVVLANREYEAWFLAGLSSLSGSRGLKEQLADYPDPEFPRDAKGRLQSYMREGTTYSETIDQAPLSARLDLDLARQRSASLDKLVRGIEAIILAGLAPQGTPTTPYT